MLEISCCCLDEFIRGLDTRTWQSELETLVGPLTETQSHFNGPVPSYLLQAHFCLQVAHALPLIGSSDYIRQACTNVFKGL